MARKKAGLAAQVLGSIGLTVEGARTRVLDIVGPGESEVATGGNPFTTGSKKALEVALRESLRLGHTDIHTEHLLTGLAVEKEGIAAQILRGSHADAGKIRAEVMRAFAGR